MLVDGAEPERLAQGGHGALGGKGAGGRELRLRVDDAGDNQGHDEVARAARRAGDERGQAELPQGAEHGGDVAMWQASDAVESVLGVDERLALQGTTDQIDDAVGQVRDVSEGFVLDPSVLAEGTSEQMGVVGLVLVAARGGGYMNGASPACHTHILD